MHEGEVIIDCIADLHGHYPALEGGDLLIVAGDLTAHDRSYELLEFGEWITKQNYKKKIVIAGNHDNLIFGGRWEFVSPKDYGWDFIYLYDSGTEFEGLKIWGSPWTLLREDMKENERAFTCKTEEELAIKFSLIPDDVDILVTHSPPRGTVDHVPLTREQRGKNTNAFDIGLGSTSLWERIIEIDEKGCGKNRLLVCGHIREGYGGFDLYDFLRDKTTWQIINASHVNENYEPVNKPIRVRL